MTCRRISAWFPCDFLFAKCNASLGWMMPGVEVSQNIIKTYAAKQDWTLKYTRGLSFTHILMGICPLRHFLWPYQISFSHLNFLIHIFISICCHFILCISYSGLSTHTHQATHEPYKKSHETESEWFSRIPTHIWWQKYDQIFPPLTTIALFTSTYTEMFETNFP